MRGIKKGDASIAASILIFYFSTFLSGSNNVILKWSTPLSGS